MHSPAGFHVASRDWCIIKILKNFHGLKQGGHDFHKKIKSDVVKYGNAQSHADPCAFHKKNAIVLHRADDYLLLAQDKKLIQDLLSWLQEDFSWNDEGFSDGCIGANTKYEDGKMILNQPQLIERVTEIMGVKDTNPKSTPVLDMTCIQKLFPRFIGYVLILK